MIVTEYKVIKRKYGIPQLKIKQNFETKYEGQPDYELLCEMLDEMYDLSWLNDEYVYVISMDTGFHIKGVYELGHGNYNTVSAYNRELFIFLLLTGAEQFVIVHNHPNGELEASESDKLCVINMNMCAKILNLKFAESIIVTEEGFLCIKSELDMFNKNMINDFENIDWDKIKL